MTMFEEYRDVKLHELGHLQNFCESYGLEPQSILEWEATKQLWESCSHAIVRHPSRAKEILYEAAMGVRQALKTLRENESFERLNELADNFVRQFLPDL